jgi:hypothetical protein
MKPALKVIATRYRIEKGVPLSPPMRFEIEFPFADMSKGDSFVMAAPGPAELKTNANRIHRQVRLFKRMYGGDYAFTTRRIPGGIRCWRVK